MLVSDIKSIRELDKLTIDSGTPSLMLMEKAGQGLYEATIELLKEMHNPSVLVVCGKGNNGGDGLVVARLLLDKGVKTTTMLLFEKEGFKGDALLNLTALEKSFAMTIDGTDKKNWPDFKSYNLIIDAIFGTGFSGNIKGSIAACIELVNSSGVKVLSADTPSGINCNTGEASNPSIMADVTITMGLPKIGQLFYPARSYMGDLRVKDIGIPLIEKESLCSKTRLITKETALSGIKIRKGDEHKNSCGRVLIVAGSKGLTGAACLASRAALKSGAGVVTLCVPESLNPIFETKLTEEMTIPLDDKGSGFLSHVNTKKILSVLENYDVLILGPGLGQNKSTIKMIIDLVKNSNVPVVLDADGINAFKNKPELLLKRKSQIVITPHEGELKRLIGCENIPSKGSERIDFVRKMQKMLPSGLLLKGPTSLVSFSNEEVYINTTGNPGMATAGTGDVLSGLIGGLYAQNKDLLKAALTGVYLHGLSGDFAAVKLTENALTAGDIITYLPRALKELIE